MMIMVIMKMVCIENNKADFDDFRFTMILIYYNDYVDLGDHHDDRVDYSVTLYQERG